MPKNTALPKEDLKPSKSTELELPKEVEDQLREYFWHKLQTFLRTAEKGKNTIVRGKYSNDWHTMGTTDDIIRWLQENLLTQAHQDTEPWTGTIAEGWMPTELNFRSEAEARQWLTTKYEEIKQSPDRYKENFGWKNKQKTYFTAKMCSETNNENGHEFDEVDVSYEISPMKFVEQLAPSEQLSEEHD